MTRETHRRKESITVTLCTIKLNMSGCNSLKQKRSLLQPILTRLHKEFNVSVSEIGLQDVWQSAWIGCVLISNDADHNARVLNKVVEFIETHFPEAQVEEFHIESH